MSTPVNLTLHQLERTYGVLFIGYVISIVLYGFTFFQTYVYFSRYPKDHWSGMSTVATLCLVDTATSGLISQALYFYLISLFPATIGLIHATTTFCAEVGLATAAVFIVQMFYATRVWSLSKSPILFGAVTITSIAAFVLGIIMTIQMFEHRAFDHLAVPHVRVIAASSQGIAFISSFITTGSLFFYLRPSRRPSMKPLDGWFDKLVAYTLTRGSIVTVVQLVYFLVFFLMPNRSYWMPFHLAASKLYINSLFTMLNSRDVYHGQGVNEEESLTSQQRRSSGTVFTSSGRRSTTGVRFNVVESKPGINIEVSRTVECDGNKLVYDLNHSIPEDDNDDSKKVSLEPEP